MAILVALGYAATATLTGTLIAFGLAVAAVIAVVLMQFIFALPAVLFPTPPWLAAQIQPVPDGAADNVNPAGSVSVTV